MNEHFVKLSFEETDTRDCCNFIVNIDDKINDKFLFNYEHMFEWIDEKNYQWFIEDVISRKCQISYEFKLLVDGTFEEFIGKLKKIYLTSLKLNI